MFVFDLCFNLNINKTVFFRPLLSWILQAACFLHLYGKCVIYFQKNNNILINHYLVINFGK